MCANTPATSCYSHRVGVCVYTCIHTYGLYVQLYMYTSIVVYTSTQDGEYAGFLGCIRAPLPSRWPPRLADGDVESAPSSPLAATPANHVRLRSSRTFTRLMVDRPPRPHVFYVPRRRAERGDRGSEEDSGNWWRTGDGGEERSSRVTTATRPPERSLAAEEMGL